MRVLVTGSTGFVGRSAVRALLGAGHRVRCLYREGSNTRPLEALEVERTLGDVRRRETLRRAVEGMDAVVHLVAILRERDTTFQEVNVQGVANIVEACRQSSVERLVHVGALGTSEGSPSRYARSKAEGEKIVRESGLRYVVLRPALILGPGGDFTERVAALIRRNRRVPVVGSGLNLLQPIFVEDVAAAIVSALEDRSLGRGWDLGGPERLTMEELVLRLARVMGLERSIRRIPPGLARLVSAASSLVRGEPLLTEDEIILMQQDVYCDPQEFVELTGRQPTDLETTLQRSLGL